MGRLSSVCTKGQVANTTINLTLYSTPNMTRLECVPRQREARGKNYYALTLDSDIRVHDPTVWGNSLVTPKLDYYNDVHR